jgi:septal ring factor EnvC (AmiA/AmiB activator)
MTEPSMETFMKPTKPVAPPPPPGLIPDGAKTVLLFLAIAGLGYVIYDGYQFQHQMRAELLKMASQIQALENKTKVGEAKISNLAGDIQETQQEVGNTKEALKKTNQQTQVAQAEVQKTKSELSHAISQKADTAQVQAQVQAIKTEADAKIGQVNNEVGGVKTEVGAVKTDLANTKRDLEGTQRQLIDVRETLTAAVAKNSSELDVLRRKGERDYTEFEIPRKNQMIKVEDIRMILTRTDPKKGKYNLQIVVDDNRLEKKDRTVNEPVQFLVGRNHLRYEVVINWVQKEKAGGYLSIPKDKLLGQERPAKQ